MSLVTMSIREEGPAAADSLPTSSADPTGSDLVVRLAREILENHTALPSSSAATAGASTFRLPASAHAFAHEPLGSSAGVGDALGGGFPNASSRVHPPVHPVLVAAELDPAPSKPLPVLPSGAREPTGQDFHAFGEPRCDGLVFGPSRRASGSRTGPLPPSSTPAVGSDGPALPGFAAQPTDEDFSVRRSISVGQHSVSGWQRAPRSVPSRPEIESIRRDFPALHQRVHGRPLIWFDNAATTHKPQAVIDATARFYASDNSNIHRAAHTLAARSTELFEAGREKVRRFVGAADAKEIVFVRGTTEAINLVAQTYGRQNIGAGDEILLTHLEHHANIVPWQILARQSGATLRVAPIDDQGNLILEEFAELLNPRTKLVAVAHVSNALGTILPVETLTRLAHAQGAVVVVDGAQSTPHLPADVRALDADFFVFSGHKVFGPTGIGALYGKTALLESMLPWQGGGHMIRDVTFEKTVFQPPPERFEAGTPDIAGVVGLGAAIDYLFGVGMPAIAAYEHSLLEYATHALSRVRGLRLVGTAARKAGVLSFVMPGKSTEAIARYLDREGIAVRAGHHCAQPAHRRFGLESTVRASLAFYNTHTEVDALVQALNRLRGT